ncbi:hypothetical protein ACGFW5_06710 [Streptomyces sp. NPDC048416]|uniref:hypothetical protein n=1 Tax=Streptomyces sp. NPDC048416 TaxID=3365546 RepID=UPI003723E12A
MPWDEWEQLKQEAAGRGSTAMRLNRLPSAQDDHPGTPSGAQGDLRVDQKDLAAIGDAAYRLRQDLGLFGGHARGASLAAAGGLATQGFALGKALDHVAVHWVDQVQSLLDACAHISNHLDYTKGAHAGDETHIYGVVSSIAELDKGFDERAGH